MRSLTLKCLVFLKHFMQMSCFLNKVLTVSFKSGKSHSHEENIH